MYISRLATEILLNIFTTIHDDFAWDDPTRATGTLAALARTCMAFKGPALDTLWRDIDGFKPIISCLPEILVERTSEGTLVSPDMLTSNCSNELATHNLK